MDDVSVNVMQFGVLADQSLDTFVRNQTRHPVNFKDLTDYLLADSAVCPEHREFFLAMTLATAIIRLAALKGARS